MKKILLSIILFFLFSSISYAGPCLTTIASASTNQLACADDDILNVTSAGSITYNDNKAVDLEDISGVQITNDGTIETEDGTNKQIAINAESSLDTTITNNGTINSDNKYAIILNYAENVVITNNAGATISAEGNMQFMEKTLVTVILMVLIAIQIYLVNQMVLVLHYIIMEPLPLNMKQFG